MMSKKLIFVPTSVIITTNKSTKHQKTYLGCYDIVSTNECLIFKYKTRKCSHLEKTVNLLTFDVSITMDNITIHKGFIYE